MSHVGIVLISHSEKVVLGIKEIIRQVVKEVPVEVAGGTDDGNIGTNIEKIMLAIQNADENRGVLLFYDLGSAKMNAELAMEMLDNDQVWLVEAPLLEGAYIAAVEASMGKTMNEVVEGVTKNFPVANDSP